MTKQDQGFACRDRRHVLMITNHGMHDWHVVPGLPDTGGQNVYVNQFTEALVKLGFRVTIVNRGGYSHPITGQLRTGVCYHPSRHARIVYLTDGQPEFVRKEDMNAQLPRLAEDLRRRLQQENDTFDLIISHYWDAGKLGAMVNGDGTGTRRIAPHIWVPHSLGALKKHNMEPSTWAELRIDERIAHERELLKSLDGCVTTSSAIRDSLRDDYGHTAKYFLPPCVDPDRYRPMATDEYEPIWSFLARHSALPAEKIRRRKLITEVSRTDQTKRKDVLIQAFAQVRQETPEALLVVTIDQRVPEAYQALTGLIDQLGLKSDVIVLGSIWEQLPLVYNATSVYCTPSVMEGFGMSAQEAAATGKPVVASNLVPFVVEYLLGPHSADIAQTLDGGSLGYILGEGGVVVMADYVDGFAAALVRLLKDDELRERMGRSAYEITIPYFTWERRIGDLLEDLGHKPARNGEQPLLQCHE